MSDEAPVKPPHAGSPAWVMTFADLMSLLMCFFVLLLSFSEMDVLKFKQLAGSMNEAFGVQREIKVKEIPKGISVIAREFSPGRPEPTLLNEVRQQTMDDLQRNLELATSQDADGDKTDNKPTDEPDEGRPGDEMALLEVAVQPPAVDDTDLREALEEEIEKGLIEIETDKQRIVVRIQEKGAFPSGSATLTGDFEPVIERIGEVLVDAEGQIVIAGHTDNVPIATARFRSNWELSSARSVTVVHHLTRITGIDQSRFLIEGHADTRPLAPNDTAENRAKNRRVEVIIVRGTDIDGGVVNTAPAGDSPPAGENASVAPDAAGPEPAPAPARS